MRYVDDEGNVMGYKRVPSVRVFGSLDSPGGVLIVPVKRGPAPDPRRREAETRVERFKRGGVL